MAYRKLLPILSFLFLVTPKISFSQSERYRQLEYYTIDLTQADTFKIKYIVWVNCGNDTTSTPILKQKVGYVVKLHADVPIYLRKQDLREDLLILDDRKITESGFVIKYKILY